MSAEPLRRGADRWDLPCEYTFLPNPAVAVVVGSSLPINAFRETQDGPSWDSFWELLLLQQQCWPRHEEGRKEDIAENRRAVRCGLKYVL